MVRQPEIERPTIAKRRPRRGSALFFMALATSQAGCHHAGEAHAAIEVALLTHQPQQDPGACCHSDWQSARVKRTPEMQNAAQPASCSTLSGGGTTCYPNGAR